MPGLLDRRLIFVLGKGGVGKSTVATALGALAARHGLRTIVTELSGQERSRKAFEQEGDPFREVQLSPNLFTISIDAQHAMEEYLRVKTGAVGHMLASSRLFAAFAMATPGMRELLSIGKIWELAQLQRRTRGAAPYDLVIVDAPATGHGVGILRTPRTFAEIAKVGPIAHQAGAIAATIADPVLTALVAVSTPEEMPVNETLSMSQTLQQDNLALDAIVLNAVYPDRFSPAEARQMRKLLPRVPAAEQAALKAALSEHTRARLQAEQRERLQRGIETELLELPYLFTERIGRPELEQLAGGLEPLAAPPAKATMVPENPRGRERPAKAQSS